MTPLISIILPVYNNENTVIAAISSILNQTYNNFELIIINDGSTDKSDEIIRGIKDDRIVYIHHAENAGLPKRLNEGIDKAMGAYIGRMDADDIALPNRLEKQLYFLQNNPTIDLVGGRAIKFKNNKIIGLLPFFKSHQEVTACVWNNIPIPHPTWLGKKEWFLRFKYAIPEIWRAEDQDLLLRAHKQSHFATIHDIVLCYRISDFDFKKVAIARRGLLKSQLSYFISHHQYLYAFASFFVFCLKSLFDIYIMISHPNECCSNSKNISPEDFLMVQNLIDKKW